MTPPPSPTRSPTFATRVLQITLVANAFDCLVTGGTPGLAHGGLGEVGLVVLAWSLLQPDAVAGWERALRGLASKLDGAGVAGLSRVQLALAACVAIQLAFGLPELRPLGVPLVWGIAALWRGAKPEGNSGPQRDAGWTWLWRGTLACAVLMRVGLLMAAPHPLYSPDSDGYAGPAHEILWGSGAWIFDPTRTPTTTLYLLLVLGTTGSYVAYLVATHALGVALPLYVARKLRPRYGELSAWLVFAALALSPRQAFYEHVVGSEALYVPCMLWFAYRVLLLWEPDARPASGAWAGAAFALTVLARPQVLPWFPFVLLALVLARMNWRTVTLFVLLSLGPLVGWCAYNQRVHGFFGMTSIGSAALFGAYGNLIDPESPGEEELKAQMAPALRQHNTFYPPWDSFMNWLAYRPESPAHSAPALQHLPPPERLAYLSALTKQAMLEHPGDVAARLGYHLWIYGRNQGALQLRSAEGYVAIDTILARDLAPGVREAVDTPLARAIERLPGRLTLGTVCARWTSLAMGRTLLAEVFEYPLWGLLFALWAFRYRGRQRLLLLVFASGSLTLLATTAALGVGWLERYYVQLIVPHAFGFAVLAGAPPSSPDPAAPPAPADPQQDGPE